MAAFNRPVTATYKVHESVRVDTQDNEDHTFCGIMFPIRAKAILPIERIIIESVAVRGQLGDISVWVSNMNDDHLGSSSRSHHVSTSFRLSSKYWTKIYQQKHKPSPRTYATLNLISAHHEPLVILPGQVRMIYIHSTLESDAAIVYDNAPTNMFGGPMNHNVSSTRYEDDKIAIHTGKAHLSFEPFGQEPIWGWGNAWRDRREFVGQVNYGTIYQLWNPDRHLHFGSNFHLATNTLLMLQRRNSVIARLPDECIYYILNMCRWDWFNDCSRDLKQRCRLRKQRHRIQQSTIEGTPDGLDESDTHEIVNDQMMDEPNDDIDVDDSMEDDDSDGANDDDSDDDDDNDDENSNSSAWERAHGYHADTARFLFSMDSSDDDHDDDRSDDDDTRHHHNHPWFGHRVARRLVVRALGGARGTIGR